MDQCKPVLLSIVHTLNNTHALSCKLYAQLYYFRKQKYKSYLPKHKLFNTFSIFNEINTKVQYIYEN